MWLLSLAWCFTDTTAGKRKKPTTRFCPNPLHNHNATPVDIPTESVFQDISRFFKRDDVFFRFPGKKSRIPEKNRI